MFRKKTYYYVITIRSYEHDRIGTYADRVEITGTRESLFKKIFNEKVELLGSDPNSTFVLFWSLEPNEL